MSAFAQAHETPDVLAALQVVDIHAAYGRIEILRGVDLTLPSGVVALLGANGAGKSTLLKVISGQLRPTSGQVMVHGHRFHGGDVAEPVRSGVCLVPEGRGVFPTLTVEENLILASSFGTPAGELIERAYALFPRLATRRNQRAGNMSGGEQQMLSLGRALASRPSLLLLDEVSMGLAPKIVTEIYDTIAAAAADGMSILLVEQYAERALAVAQSAAVMHGGRIIANGPPDEIRLRLKDLYLGGNA
ncbi:MAG TPA: ABC transporter ATP-binding protein [Kineosporiaceae bacterium]|nr:ABC transporter ATP-binding protein [Kineosporiaceae bacterium]